VTASRATTLLGGSAMYMTPSTTSGVTSTTLVVGIPQTYFTLNQATFSRRTWSNSL